MTDSFSLPTRRTLYRVDIVPDRSAVGEAAASLAHIPPPSASEVLGGPPPVSVDALDDLEVDRRLLEPAQRLEWLVDELLQPGSIFHLRVSTDAVAEPAAGLSRAAFTELVRTMLDRSVHLLDVCLPGPLVASARRDGPRSAAQQRVQRGGSLLAGLFQHYWRAVATAFAEAWDDPQGFVLWQPHGLEAFAKLGPLVVLEQVAAYDIHQHYFDDALEHIAARVSLAVDDAGSVVDPSVPEHERAQRLFDALADARGVKRGRLNTSMAVPNAVGDIDWGSVVPPASPPVGSASFAPEG